MLPGTSGFRIVFLTEEYPPDAGGVATSAQRVARNLTRLGHAVLILAFDNRRPTSAPSYVLDEKDEAVEVRRVGPFFRKIHGPVAEDEETRSVIRRRIFDVMERLSREFRAQLVLSFFASNAGLLGAYLSRSLEVPHVVGFRGLDAGQYIFSLKHLALLRTITDSATRIACVNTHLKRRLLLAFPNLAGCTRVIHNSVELSPSLGSKRPRLYLNDSAQWPQQAVVVAFIGSPREKKGTSLLIEALSTARKSVDLRLLIVGSSFRPEDRERCGETIDRLTADGAIHITGFRARPDALEIAAEADIIVMPSLDDGLPNGLLEGMALGLCPIVSDLFQDIVIDGSTGWVVKRDDSADLSAALVSAALSPEKRESFGAKAKAFVASHHHPSIEAVAYDRLFREIVL